MDAQDIINTFRSELDEVERRGSSTLEISDLRTYLFKLEKNASSSKEQRTYQHEGSLARMAAQNTINLAMLSAVLETGKAALQALLVINGGAVVALLGVLSNLAGKPEGNTLARYLALPLLQFGVAVLLGALGFAFRYLSQDFYAKMQDEKSIWTRLGDGFKCAAIVCAFLGYVLFGFAMFNSYKAVLWAF